MVGMARLFKRDPFEASIRALPVGLSLRLQYRRAHGYFPHVSNPATFSEKIQYRKLYEDTSRFSAYADKVAAKGLVGRILGEDFIIPTLWTGKQLPAEPDEAWPIPFVVKANHTSGWNVFVRDLATTDWHAVRRQTAWWPRVPFAAHLHESWYRRIDPLILIEPMVGDGIAPPDDYKFYVFHGRVRYIQVDTGRFSEHRRVIFDREWRRQPFGILYPIETREVKRPRHLEEMIAAAEKLGRDFSFVRADFYDLEEGPKFGELTFAPESGFGRFSPTQYDRVLGDLWDITRGP
jgi:hypothetical protein